MLAHTTTFMHKNDCFSHIYIHTRISWDINYICTRDLFSFMRKRTSYKVGFKGISFLRRLMNLRTHICHHAYLSAAME